MEISQVQAIQEQIRFENPFMSLRIFQAASNQDGGCTWHFHKELEILCVLKGRLDVYVEETQYTLSGGDVIIIGAKEPHKDHFYRIHGLEYIVLQFDIEQFVENSTLNYFRSISEPGFSLHKLNYIFRENPQAAARVLESVEEILLEVQQKNEGYEMAASLQVKSIMLTLLRNDTRHLISLKERGDMMRLKPVLDYVEENLENRIQVEEVCRLANVSYYYFVKYFKKVMGMSFLEYVNYKKIKKAERMLLTQDVSVTQVADSIGMPNMAHFYKVFRKYNRCSPNEYRKKMG